ncbi:MAG: glutathione S-transferase family protein [Rhodospirillales bacterium]
MTYRLYDDMISGNGFKVRLLLAQLELPYSYVALDIREGETRQPGFLAINPNGRIPTLELPDGRFLAESNAILFYLAQGTPFWPTDRYAQAQTLQWLFFEQYSHEPYIATLRAWLSEGFGGKTPEEQAEIPRRREKGYQALAVMEEHLQSHSFFVEERYGLADIALYAYTHVAGDGGFDLAPYPALGGWLARIAAQPRHIPITQQPPVTQQPQEGAA